MEQRRTASAAGSSSERRGRRGRRGRARILGAAGLRRPRRRRRRAPGPAGQARRAALLDPRRDHAPQHREQPRGRPGPDDGLPRRPELPGRPDRPRAAGAAARRVHRGLRVPRVRGLPRLRVLPVHPERQRARAPAHASRRSARTSTTRGSLSFGTHTGGLAAMVNPTTTRSAQIDIAHTLGHTMIGTAGDPVGGGGREPARQLAGRGQQLQPRRRGPGGRGPALLPRTRSRTTSTSSTTRRTPSSPGSTASTGSRSNTDPSVVFFEPDILHSYAGRARFPDPVDGVALARAGLLEGATRSGSSPGTSRTAAGSCRRPPAASNPFTQTLVRAPGFTDAILVGRGLDRPGLPGRSRTRPSSATSGIFDEVGEKGSQLLRSSRATAGPAPASDPGRSLRHAKYSLQNLLGLRGGVKAQGKSTVADEAIVRERLPSTDRAPAAPSPSPASRRPWASRRRRGVTAIRPGTTSRRISCTRRSPTGRSQALELQLLGLLQAVQRDGYPIKVALVGGEDDLDRRRRGCSGSPQRYAEQLVADLEVRAAGHGPAARGHAARPRGRGARDGGRRLRTGHAGERAGAARAARRSAARPTATRWRRPRSPRCGGSRGVGGHALPADVPPARLLAPGPSRAGGGEGSTPGWLPLAVFAAVFLLAWLAYELRIRAPRRRRPVIT